MARLGHASSGWQARTRERARPFPHRCTRFHSLSALGSRRSSMSLHTTAMRRICLFRSRSPSCAAVRSLPCRRCGQHRSSQPARSSQGTALRLCRGLQQNGTVREPQDGADRVGRRARRARGLGPHLQGSMLCARAKKAGALTLTKHTSHPRKRYKNTHTRRGCNLRE